MVVLHESLNAVINSSYAALQESQLASRRLKALPRGIIHAQSDLERRPLWGKSSSKSKVGFSVLFVIRHGISSKLPREKIVSSD